MFPFHRKHGNNANSYKQSGKRRASHRENDETEMSDEEYLEYLHNNDRGKHQLTSIAHDRYCDKILREKEEVLLSALNSAVETSAPQTNRFRLGPANNNIFKCLLRDGATDEDADESGSGSGGVRSDERFVKRGESFSMPSSPVDNSRAHFLRAENVSRRKSDTMADARELQQTMKTGAVATAATANQLQSKAIVDDDQQREYILTLKIDNLVSDVEDVSFYRIGPKRRENYGDNNNDRCYSSSAAGSGGEEKYELADSMTDLSQLSDNCCSCDDEESTSSAKTKTSTTVGGGTGGDCNYGFIPCQQLDVETNAKLKKLMIGENAKCYPVQWLRQCFSFCHIPASRWRLVQIKSGSCGVIAAVEAFLIKSLLFDPGLCKFKEPLRPNQKEVADAFVQAISYILWQAGDFQKAAILIPKSVNHTACTTKNQTATESFTYAEYYDFELLKEAVAINIKYFTSPPYNGYLNFITSVIMSRGICNVKNDMDDEAPLITENGHCSLELVMLLVTGQAVSNVFDNDIQIDTCLLKGVKKRVDVGFLSLFEHMNTCEVGSRLKSPRFPIWLVNCSDHFTVLFSNKVEHAQHTIQQPFVLYHYDSMTSFSCDNDIKLVIDPMSNYSDEQLGKDQTQLQLCIRTKWKKAIVIYAENSELFLV